MCIRGAMIGQKVYCDMENPYCDTYYCDTPGIFISVYYCPSSVLTHSLSYFQLLLVFIGCFSRRNDRILCFSPLDISLQ